ncbi:class I adenylate-forming enzyme family protein [Actinocorallia longicatena]|uniref:Acyl-CoA synthetase (AMP-forming)/AMP-acid ligase II n=1 Tax=Actinocorallia longicatena TaxID=111803 RepID=A0ABP6QFL8_9ACTN
MKISVVVDMAADGFADRVLVGRRSTGLTAARLRAVSRAGARRIRAAGADALLYLGVNGPAFPVALFAAAQAGVPLVPVNYRLGGEQLRSLLARHPQALGLGGPVEAALLREAGITALTFEEWLETPAEADEDIDEHADPEAVAAIIYTSGTTSAPKGVLVRHRNLLAYVFGTVEFASAGEDEAALISVPPYHIAAVANAITNLYSGRRTIVLEQFTPSDWLDHVRIEGVTHALVVPTMLARIVGAASGPGGDLPSLRSLAYGGAPMPASVIEAALRRWPHVGFVNAYGLTETSSTIAVLGPADHRAALASEDPAIRARLSSAGRAVPGVELAVRGEDGKDLPPGETGRIWVRGGQVAAEYTGSGSATDAGGWFDTRDQGRLDEDGYLFIGGRADDTIIRGAENIAPAEIEDVLLGHPDVEDAIVVGVPDEEWGQRIEGAVVLRAGATPDSETLRAHVRSRLRGSKTPDRIALWTSIPRTETGKLVRRDALRLLLEATGSEGGRRDG